MTASDYASDVFGSRVPVCGMGSNLMVLGRVALKVRVVLESTVNEQGARNLVRCEHELREAASGLILNKQWF